MNKPSEKRGTLPAIRGPRWGFGRPAHPEIAAVLEAGVPRYAGWIDRMAAHRAFLHSIPHQTESARTPCWRNPFFSTLDAAALVTFLLETKPKTYVEIGSGNSTKFARHTIEHGRLATHVLSVDPQPRAEIDSLCDETIRAHLQSCPFDLFERLQPGDILFFDGSHRAETNSDVTVFFLEVLPRLKPGVLVHVHDIFWPVDYIPEFTPRNYNEQYFLGMLLLYGAERIEVTFPNYFVSSHPALAENVRALFANPQGRNIPLHYKQIPQLLGVSFWFETRAAGGGCG